MGYIYRSLFPAVAIVLLYACGARRSGTDTLQQWIGSSVTLPDDFVVHADGRDIVWTAFDTTTYARMVIYYNAEGCTPCKLKELLTWESLITAYDQAKHTRFAFILNADNATPQELDQIAYSMRFTHPILIDTAYSFERSNPQLPHETIFHVFLLDRNNRVVLAGSPIGNPKMWELYKNTIARLETSEGIIPKEEAEQ